jgi:hypothetical protein
MPDDISHEGNGNFEDISTITYCGLEIGTRKSVTVTQVRFTDEPYADFYDDTAHSSITCEACILLKFAETAEKANKETPDE